MVVGVPVSEPVLVTWDMFMCTCIVWVQGYFESVSIVLHVCVGVGVWYVIVPMVSFFICLLAWFVIPSVRVV